MKKNWKKEPGDKLLEALGILVVTVLCMVLYRSGMLKMTNTAATSVNTITSSMVQAGAEATNLTLESENCEHTYSALVTKEPTYVEEGVLTYTCGKCHTSYTEPIEKLVARTCTISWTYSYYTSIGSWTSACSSCGTKPTSIMIGTVKIEHSNCGTGSISKSSVVACPNCKHFSTYTGLNSYNGGFGISGTKTHTY
jgi:competence protein ComGC